MRVLMIAAAGLLLLAGRQQQAAVPATGAGAISSAIVATQQACVTIAPALQAASVSGNPTAQSIGQYGNAVCGPLAAGAVPATVDSSTPTWLGTLGGMIKVLLPLAALLLHDRLRTRKAER